MSTKMTGFRQFSKNLCVLVLYTKVASALKGLIPLSNLKILNVSWILIMISVVLLVLIGGILLILIS